MNFNYDLINDEIINQNTFIKNNFLLTAFDLNIMEHFKDFRLMTLYVTKNNFIKFKDVIPKSNSKKRAFIQS